MEGYDQKAGNQHQHLPQRKNLKICIVMLFGLCGKQVFPFLIRRFQVPVPVSVAQLVFPGGAVEYDKFSLPEAAKQSVAEHHFFHAVQDTDLFQPIYRIAGGTEDQALVQGFHGLFAVREAV